jgi:HlyD family secretion protein
MDALNKTEQFPQPATRIEARGEDGPRPEALRPGADDAARRARDRRRRLAGRVRQALLGVVVLAAALGVVLALRPRPVPVDVATAARGSLVVAIEETGVARVKDRYVVSAPVSGTVTRQLLEPGDPVAELQVVAEIAPLRSPLLDARTRSEAQARLSAALSALGLAEAQQGRATAAEAMARDELARARALAAGGSVAAQELDRAGFEARMRAEELSSAVFAVKVAAEQVRVARATLGGEGAVPDRHVDVLAPASGRVLRVLQESEGVVQAGAPLLEVGNPEALELVVDLLTTDAVRVHPGTPVTVQGWGGRGRSRPACAGSSRRPSRSSPRSASRSSG